MHRSMSWKAFKPFTLIYKILYHFIVFVFTFKIRILCKRFIYSYAYLSWHHLCYVINHGIRQIQYSSYILYNRSCRHSTKCNYLRNTILAILFYDVIYDLLSSFITEIHINIGHGYSLRIKETFKNKTVFNRIKVSYLKTI